MTLTMFDTVTVDTVPDNPEAVAGYVGGSWPTYAPLVAKFPKAHHLSIAVNASEQAECLDCEPGDAVPAQVAGWVKAAVARGVHLPAVYSSVSEMPQVIADLAAAGIVRAAVRLWTAHYTDVPHLCGPHCGFGFDTTADATQYTDHALGRNLDASLVDDAFFAAPVAPTPDPHHYDRFPVGPFETGTWGKLDERQVVEQYDKDRPHYVKDHKQLALLRAQLQYLADRVWTVAHQFPEKDGKPSWDQFARGWRYQELRHRADGQTVNG